MFLSLYNAYKEINATTDIIAKITTLDSEIKLHTGENILKLLALILSRTVTITPLFFNSSIVSTTLKVLLSVINIGNQFFFSSSFSCSWFSALYIFYKASAVYIRTLVQIYKRMYQYNLKFGRIDTFFLYDFNFKDYIELKGIIFILFFEIELI